MLDNNIAKFGHSKTQPNLFLATAVAATLTVNQRVVHVTGQAGAIAVTLPPVSECSGLVFTFKVLDDSSTNTVTIQDQDDSYIWADIVCAGAGGDNYAILYCDGQMWFNLASDIA